MSATAAKILKMEQEREKTTVEKVSKEQNTYEQCCAAIGVHVYTNSTAVIHLGLDMACMLQVCGSLCYMYMCVMQE